MKRAAGWIAATGATLLATLSLANASWLAPVPADRTRIMAHGAVSQQLRQDELHGGECVARHMAPPVHHFLENTVPAIVEADRLGADLVEVDVLPTADGKVMLFHDAQLDCRTDGHGPARARTAAGLRALDVGHGWTADGGRTFPLRGRYRGAMPDVERAVAALPRGSFLFNFKSDDPREADLLAAALKRAGRNPVAAGDAFFGTGGAPVRRIGELYPQAWRFDVSRAIECSFAYAKWGWLAITPAVCRGAALIVPINRRHWFAGWPNRAIARMHAVGARVILTGPYDGHSFNAGLTRPDQLAAVPARFDGYVWVEDMAALAPAIAQGP